MECKTYKARLVNLIFYTLFTVLANLSIVNLTYAEEIKVIAENIPNALKAPGELLEASFDINTTNDITPTLLLKLDEELINLIPYKKNVSDTNTQLNFQFPSPLVSLEYFLIISDNEKIIVKSSNYKLTRDCLPELKSIVIDQNQAKSKIGANLFSKAKQLESEYNNLLTASENLEILKAILDEK